MVVRVVGSARKIKSAPKLGRAERHFRRNMKRENSGKVCFWIDLIKTSSARFFFSKKANQKWRKSNFNAATNKLTRPPSARPPAKFVNLAKSSTPLYQ
jgi:hypothetical protein